MTKTDWLRTLPSARSTPSTSASSSTSEAGHGRASAPVNSPVAARRAVGRTHDVGVGIAEDLGERAVQGVGEDERAGHERHAEDDRERAHRQPQLAREQALEGCAGASVSHRALARRGVEALHPLEHALGGRARSSRRRCGRRPGTAPGRRTTAAIGSWVTMTTVWPNSSHRPTQERRAPPRRSASRGCRSARRRTRCPAGSTSARAHATRCCWPPESSLGLCPSRSPQPDGVDDGVEPLAGRACGRRCPSAA